MLRMAWNCLPGLLSFHLDYCLVGTATGPHIHAILVVLITASHLVSHSKPIWGRRPEWVFRLHASAFASVRSSVFAVQAFVGANWLKGLCPTCKIRKYRIQLCSSSTLSSNINYCDKTVAFVKSVTAKSNHSGPHTMCPSQHTIGKISLFLWHKRSTSRFLGQNFILSLINFEEFRPLK